MKAPQPHEGLVGAPQPYKGPTAPQEPHEGPIGAPQGPHETHKGPIGAPQGPHSHPTCQPHTPHFPMRAALGCSSTPRRGLSRPSESGEPQGTAPPSHTHTHTHTHTHPYTPTHPSGTEPPQPRLTPPTTSEGLRELHRPGGGGREGCGYGSVGTPQWEPHSGNPTAAVTPPHPPHTNRARSAPVAVLYCGSKRSPRCRRSALAMAMCSCSSAAASSQSLKVAKRKPTVAKEKQPKATSR